MATPLPPLDGRSTAAAFLEEHDRLAHDLAAAGEQNKQLKDINIELSIRIDQMTRERDWWRTRCNQYFSYAVELGVQLQTLVDGLTNARAIALQITREKLAMVSEEEEGGQKVADVLRASERSVLPPNQLPS